uniref:Heat shock protein 70 n=1 Tax=Panagrolaimus davidi TaxID=227884 RepID=A0A914PBL1_9BILA
MAIGIDLGTSRCCAAVNRRSGIITVPLDNKGERLLPSFVAYDEAHVKCGQIVIDRLQHHANASVFDAKRIIGKELRNINVDSSWPFTLAEAENKVFSNDSAPEEVSSDLLKHIKSKAEGFQGDDLTQVIITVPVTFSEKQIRSTYMAAYLADWFMAYVIPEPVAATFAYFMNRPIPNAATILVFDLGGGTLDVCILKIYKGKLEILSRSGDPNLGGRDFDNLLIKYFTKKMAEDYNVIVPDKKKYRIIFDVEEIDSSQDYLIPITREIFETLSTELLQKIQCIIFTTLNKINMNVNKIEMVLQVGGGCRMPMIKKLLKDIFPKAEHVCEKHPEEVVAIGAAYYAYYLNVQKNNGQCVIS